ncbi:gelsolin, cytoplasmic isoform X2 [Parasteatoda tepidariorum]|uniref:gelsolin, cytoplasmic isoform X2 n=1 Tax=Parasteatoda tepidariorum TaxID=114398 RepID=UPI001C71F4A0|nr:gelsolin, cytoplasmic isoform X2 [Parasteatoda tepidariorum]
MTAVDPAFEGVGQQAGIDIWRIENFEVKSVPSAEYGNFYTGDAYIILKTSEEGQRLEWNIHFWIGEESSQDEFGTAAIKSVELDDSLGGSPVQHREVQNHESSLFLSYFKKGIRYLQGGVKSGFHHVVDVPVQRLLRVKGRRNVRLHQVPVAVSSLNNGDCFIFDNGPTIFVFVGHQSGRMERIKAIQAANAIRDDIHCGRSIVKIIDDNDEASEFFEQLGGGSMTDVAEAVADDDDFVTNFDSKVGLYRVSEDECGELQVECIAYQPLKQEYLNNDDCFLLDGGMNGLFVWIGKESSRQERVGAMNFAHKYIEKKSYPNYLPIQRIVHEAETPEFKSYFSVWREPTFEREKSLTDGATDYENAKHRLLSKSAGKALSFMPDDGSGEVEIWRVDNFDIVPVESSQKGIFFGGDCYIVKYMCTNSSPHCILYFWLGQSSTQDERATAAIMTVRMSNDMNAVQIRVVHGQEPEHFLRIFKGQMVIMSGGHASGFKNIHDFDSYDVDGTRLFQVRGTNHYNTRAEQIPESSCSLNSNDVFILETPTLTYLWIGQDSFDEEQAMGRSIMKIVSPDRNFTEIKEGEEPEEFWSPLGGKEEYPKSRDLPSRPIIKPRLFRLSNRSGKMKIEEMCNFTQEDLCEDDVMILDAGDIVYLWIGKGANEEEKSGANKLAEDYMSCEPSDRNSESISIVTLKQGVEPESFKSFFQNWNPSMWEDLSQLLLPN